MCITTFTTPKLIGVWASPVSSNSNRLPIPSHRVHVAESEYTLFQMLFELLVIVTEVLLVRLEVKHIPNLALSGASEIAHDHDYILVHLLDLHERALKIECGALQLQALGASILLIKQRHP